MASPLSIFRKHQATLMVGLVFVALASFVVIPSIDVLRPSAQSGDGEDEVVVTWDGGRLRESDLGHMRRSHNIAVLYLSEVVRETLSREGTPRGRGVTRSIFQQIVDPGIPASSSDDNLVYTFLLAKKAESLGMMVSREAVVEFLEQLSDGVIPTGDFRAIFDRTMGNNVTEEFLIDQLRTELLAQRMRETMESGLYVPPAGALTPGRAWEYFQRLNRMVQADLVALPVSSFYDELPPPPSDAALEAGLYQEGKDRFPDPDQPEPGFKRRRRAAFDFVRADFDRFLEVEKAKMLPEISDEDIEREYEDNKTRYVLPATPPPSGVDDAATEPSGESAEGDESTEPQNAVSTDSASSDSPAADSGQPDPAASDPPADQDEAASDPGDQSLLESSAEFFVNAIAQEAQPAGEQVPPGETAAAADAVGGDTAEPEPEADAVTEPATQPNAADSDPADAAPDAGDGEAVAGDEAAEEEVKYRPLDEELRAQIREELADNRARKPAQDRLDASLDEIRRQVTLYARKLRVSEFKRDEGPVEDFSLSDLERDELLEIGEVPLVNALTVQDYELGRAYETEFISWPPRRIEFSETAFREGEPLYTPVQISGAESGVTFVFWKTENHEPVVPKFEEVREEVVEAWKRREALAIARKEASRLAERARSGGAQRLGEVFQGNDGLTVVTTDLFSWLSTGFNPSGMGEPGLSNVEGVEGAGPEFMQSVFSLRRDEAGVAVNQPQDTVFVVKIVLEAPTEEVLRQRFLESGVTFEVSSIANRDNVDLQRQWYDELEQEMGVVWERPPAF